MTFLYRALMVDEETLRRIMSLVDLQKELYEWQQHFESTVHCYSSHYNMHLLQHALKSRLKTGPLWTTSTERFESMYGDAKRNYHLGTMSVGKQILLAAYRKDNYHHQCLGQRKLALATSGAEKKDDSWVTKGKKFYKVVEVLDGGRAARCRPLQLRPFSTADVGLDVPWDLVGVHKRGELEICRPKVISERDIDGKVIMCEEICMKFNREWFLLL